MEELYGYVFWHNYLEEVWYAIPTNEYLIFFNGNKEKAQGVLKSKSIDTLIYGINNPGQLPSEM